jgi:hypothetical protein
MAYKDKQKQYRSRRNAKRKAKHGWDWRGIIEYYGRACANIADPDMGELCWEVFALELHEPFGEDKRKVEYDMQGKMQLRILLCRHCHSEEHGGNAFPLDRGQPSKYLEDTEAEIEDCGGMRFHLIEVSLVSTLRTRRLR